MDTLIVFLYISTPVLKCWYLRINFIGQENKLWDSVLEITFCLGDIKSWLYNKHSSGFRSIHKYIKTRRKTQLLSIFILFSTFHTVFVTCLQSVCVVLCKDWILVPTFPHQLTLQLPQFGGQGGEWKVHLLFNFLYVFFFLSYVQLHREVHDFPYHWKLGLIFLNF